MLYRCDWVGWNTFRGERGERGYRGTSWNRHCRCVSNHALTLSTGKAFTISSGNLFQQGLGNCENKNVECNFSTIVFDK